MPIGISIAQRSQRPQRGDIGDESSAVDFVGHVREPPGEDKYRTEVTEVTEGGFGWTKASAVDFVGHVREPPGRISIAQRSQRPQRGILGDESSAVDFVGHVRGPPEEEKHRTEATEGILGDESSAVDFVGHVREPPGEDKHRTSVTKEDFGGRNLLNTTEASG
jgi:hypothetical protein